MYLILKEVFSYLNSTCDSRNIREGEQIVNSNHIISCGICNKSDNYIKIFSLCLQTSALNSQPHEISGTIKFSDGNVNTHSVYHGSAIMILYTKNNKSFGFLLLRFVFCFRCDTDNLEVISQTDKACTWNLLKTPSLEKYKPQPLLETPCFKNLKFSEAYTFDKKVIFSKLLESSSCSALFKHKVGRRACTINVNVKEKSCNKEDKDISGVYELFCDEGNLMQQLAELNVNFEHNACCERTFNEKFIKDLKDIFIKTKCDETLWKAERQFRITGSRCYAIFTYQQDNWRRKSINYFWPKSVITPAMHHGRVNENLARTTYKNTNGVEIIQTGLYVSKLNPWLGYSPDGIIMEDGTPVKLLEIKCVQIGMHQTANVNNEEFLKKCSFLCVENGKVSLKKKHAYYGQVQLGMAMLNLQSTDFIVFATFDNAFITVPVNLDYHFCQEMLFKLKQNFYSNMLHVICEYK